MPNQYTASTKVQRFCETCGEEFYARPSEVARGRGRFCSVGCITYRRRPLTERFWSKVAVKEPDECWLWLGSTDPAGYGRINVYVGNQPEMHLAHRVSYELHNGGIRNDLLVCHTCDNPPCVNPYHLFQGTSKENSQDARAKGRSATGERNGQCIHPETRPRGETNGAARLRDADVREIRLIYAKGGVSQREIASRFGIDQGSISLIVRRKIWKHLEE